MQSIKQKVESSLSLKRYKAQLHAHLSNERAKSYPDFLEINAAYREAVKNAAIHGEQEKLSEAEERRNVFLKEIGLSPNDIDESFYCAICRDTGVFGGRRCKCVSDEYSAFLEVSGMNSKFSFELSTHSVENDGVFSYCKEYASEAAPKPNILLIGRGGTGKTYLANAIGGALSMRGRDVMYYTSFDLNLVFLQVYLSRLEERHELWNNIIGAQYLILDDLGTEQQHKATLTSLFNLLNQRIVFSKNTVITSNLHPEEILKLYGERIFSRLTDRNTTYIASLSGSNLRHKQIKK